MAEAAAVHMANPSAPTEAGGAPGQPPLATLNTAWARALGTFVDSTARHKNGAAAGRPGPYGPGKVDSGGPAGRGQAGGNAGVRAGSGTTTLGANQDAALAADDALLGKQAGEQGDGRSWLQRGTLCRVPSNYLSSWMITARSYSLSLAGSLLAEQQVHAHLRRVMESSNTAQRQQHQAPMPASDIPIFFKKVSLWVCQRRSFALWYVTATQLPMQGL